MTYVINYPVTTIQKLNKEATLKLARPAKCKRVCSLPGTLEFLPVSSNCGAPPVLITVEEYETIRLIDKEGLSQLECADSMGVARTTVQQIYTSARKKIAEALVEGLPLMIKGGEYKVCEGSGSHSWCHGCGKRRCQGEKMEE